VVSLTDTNEQQDAAMRASMDADSSPLTARRFEDARGNGRLRVLHVHSGNMYGGVETMLLTQVRLRNLLPALEVSFALCFEGQFSEELIAAGAPLHWLGHVRIRHPLSIKHARARLREFLSLESFDVVVTHSSWSQAIFGKVVRDASIPLVFHQHGIALGQHWLEWLARRTEPDAALCNSSFTAATLRAMYPRARSEVVYCPVAAPSQIYSVMDRRETRAELGTDEDATVIIQVGRMEAWKGQSLHLEALSRLKDLKGWGCWLVGGAQRPCEKKYLDELQSAAVRLGIAERVRFLGQRADVSRLLAASDVYCQPNIGPEPFGIAFIEALHAGLPVLTTAQGGAREIVDETCGVLVPAGDAKALAAALRRLVTDENLRARLGAAGPARARQLCDPATQMLKLHRALAAIISRGQLKG
jgi:glycosyltransferase involved in cell wall biosynthesis